MFGLYAMKVTPSFGNGRQHKVLLIEDNELYRDNVEEALRGYAKANQLDLTIVAPDKTRSLDAVGDEFVRMVKQGDHPIVLLDNNYGDYPNWHKPNSNPKILGNIPPAGRKDVFGKELSKLDGRDWLVYVSKLLQDKFNPTKVLSISAGGGLLLYNGLPNKHKMREDPDFLKLRTQYPQILTKNKFGLGGCPSSGDGEPSPDVLKALQQQGYSTKDDFFCGVDSLKSYTYGNPRRPWVTTLFHMYFDRLFKK